MREGALSKNEIGRWEFGGLELTSGSVVEVLLAGQWVRGRIEYLHDLQEYQLIVSSGKSTETFLVLHAGMPARTPN